MFDPVPSIFISDYAINNFGIAYFCGILVGWLIKNPANAGFFNYMAERKGTEHFNLSRLILHLLTIKMLNLPCFLAITQLLNCFMNCTPNYFCGILVGCFHCFQAEQCRQVWQPLVLLPVDTDGNMYSKFVQLSNAPVVVLFPEY